MLAGDLVLLILRTLLGILSAGMLAYWSVGLYRLIRTIRDLPTARDGLKTAQGTPFEDSVCVVVPAHNEEHSLPIHILSLKAQDYPGLNVVLSLDRCSDGTYDAAVRAVGNDERFEIVVVDRCPDDWAGKVHAVFQGVQRSTAASNSDYLLFADADTRFHPSCIRATVALAKERKADLVSLLSTLTYDRWYEWFVQMSACLELMYQYPVLRANREERRRAFANGQFMLFRREAYLHIGGHEAVKGELLEDLALARLVAENRLRAAVLPADGMLVCTMYESWNEFRHGWKRIYSESARCDARRLRKWAARARITGTLLPLAAFAGILLGITTGAIPVPAMDLVARTATGISSVALLVWALVMAGSHRVAHAPLWAFPATVAGSWIVGGVLAAAAADIEAGRPTLWGDRYYVRRPGVDHGASPYPMSPGASDAGNR